MNRPLQPTAEASGKPDSCAASSVDQTAGLAHGAIEIELLEPYWEEDFSEQEWCRNVGRSSRKPSLDDYDRWVR